MAASVVFMGPFSPEERYDVRQQIIDYLTRIRYIPCNEAWLVSNKPENRGKKLPNIFALTLRDLGLKDLLVSQNMPSCLTESDLAESLFSVLFAPSLPVITDPTG